MDLGIANRIALVTGASAGIGRAIAAELAAEGCRVAIASRSRERIDAAAADIGATAFVFDARDDHTVPALIEEVSAALGGPPEIVVANTGGPPAHADPLALPREAWEDAYRSLVLTPMALVEHAMGPMRAAGWGRILNVSSISVREPVANIVLSNAHRSGALSAFKTVARSVAADGVTLNSILTGWVATDRSAQLHGSLDAAQAAARREVPAGRLGTVEELAAVAAFLCSERASFVTGEAIRVDGGMTRAV